MVFALQIMRIPVGIVIGIGGAYVYLVILHKILEWKVATLEIEE